MSRLPAIFAVLSLAACGDAKVHSGTSNVKGTVEGLALEAPHGIAITYNAGTTLRVAPSTIGCEVVDGVDHLTIDFARSGVGSYHVVPGFPLKTSLAGFEARAHACPPTTPTKRAVCHNLVRSGTVNVTRYDAAGGGAVEGDFDIVFADGRVTGSFSAVNCPNGAQEEP